MSFGQFFVKPSTALLALVILVGSTVLLGRFNPKNPIIERLCNQYFSTDQTPFYSPPALFKMLDMYSPNGEETRAHIRFIYLDLIYPVVYAVTGTILLAFLLPILLPTLHAKFPYLSLLPVAAAVFDYLENLSMLWILRNYPPADSRTFGIAYFSSAMTTSKMFLMCAILLLLIVGFGALVLRASKEIGR